MATPTLREALEMLVEEKCDYMRLNNLGDPETQHTVKTARAALASPREPVAWIEFADNGNIRFWTSDPARAWTEGENGRPLRKFTLAEFVALAAKENAAIAAHPTLSVEAIARALCESHGTAQCAAICLSHSSLHTTDGNCPEAKTVWKRQAAAIAKLWER